MSKLSKAIILFIILFTVVHLVKPKIIYDKYGGFRNFGVGYRNKTVFPIWVISIILAILSYTFVLYIRL
jgi:hypothetical protein